MFALIKKLPRWRTKNLMMWWGLLAFSILLLASCKDTPISQSDEGPLSVLAGVLSPKRNTSSSPQPTNTAVPATAVADTPTPLPIVNFMGVSFQHDLLYSGDLQEQTIMSAMPNSPLNGPGHPEHIRFTFGEQLTPTSFSPHFPQLFIFPVDHFAKQYDDAQAQISALQTLLDAHPHEIDEPMPMLPLMDMQEIFHSTPTYFSFVNGRGVSFITQYAPEGTLIANEKLFYTFQGLTNDEQSYVAAYFPIEIPNEIITDTAVDKSLLTNATVWKAYLNDIVSRINTLPLSEFTPDPTQLNFMMTSLDVQSDHNYAAAIMPQYIEHEGVLLGFDETIMGEATAVTIPAQLTTPDGELQLLYDVPDFIQFQFTNEEAGQRPLPLTVQPIRNDTDAFFSTIPDWHQKNIRQLENELNTEITADKLGAHPHMLPVRFQNGSGTRAITIKSDTADDPPTFAYHYQGVTDDGKYYVTFTHPLTLTESATTALATNNETSTLSAMISNMPTINFHPDMTLLDHMFKTLAIAPDASTLSSLPANPVNCINNTEFVSDITIPDETIIESGETFTKIWRVRNSGTCTWTPAYKLIFNEGDTLEWTDSSTIGIVAPGEETDVTVTLIAPAEPGNYKTWWQLSDAADQPFEDRFFIHIETPKAITTASGHGIIEGAINFPSGGETPAMIIYFDRVDSGERYALQTEKGWTRYRNEIPVGEYIVFARVAGDDSDFGGGYTNSVQCGLTADCNDHSLITVNVTQSKVARNIDIADWYAPAGTFPLP